MKLGTIKPSGHAQYINKALKVQLMKALVWSIFKRGGELGDKKYKNTESIAVKCDVGVEYLESLEGSANQQVNPGRVGIGKGGS